MPIGRVARATTVMVLAAIASASGCEPVVVQSRDSPCRVGADCAVECGAPGTYSYLDAWDRCTCESGYAWCNPADPVDYGCCSPCPAGTYYEGGYCYCEAPLHWCKPGDPNDLSCCGGDDTDGGTGETGSGGTDGGTPPPATCSASEEGYFYCTHTEAMGPDGSRFYVCSGGQWVEDVETPDRICREDGYSAAAGCVDDGTQVVFVCDP